jgi:hypothetical protein
MVLSARILFRSCQLKFLCLTRGVCNNVSSLLFLEFLDKEKPRGPRKGTCLEVQAPRPPTKMSYDVTASFHFPSLFFHNPQGFSPIRPLPCIGTIPYREIVQWDVTTPFHLLYA